LERTDLGFVVFRSRTGQFRGRAWLLATNMRSFKVVAAVRFPQAQSEMLVETVIAILKDTLASGEELLFSGFGKFCVRQKRERDAWHFHNSEKQKLKARKVVTFKWSGQLRKKHTP
jgi:integration host factor subunit alpha